MGCHGNYAFLQSPYEYIFLRMYLRSGDHNEQCVMH